MSSIAIVVIAYNRLESLKRLLASLEKANYENDEVTLIISIDKSENPLVVDYAKKFVWEHGKIEVIAHEKKLGLRKHVLSCGNITERFDSVIALEDDIYVSRNFYIYTKQSIAKYENNKNIAGISLYTHQWNIGANRPFVPQHNGYDAFFFQYAQSWGQVWTKSMWSSFYDWYQVNSKIINNKDNVPNYIKNWPASSWLKYYNFYIADTNKYFVYPYIGLTSNFSDTGTHNTKPRNSYQVTLSYLQNKNYKFPDFDDNALKYDIFFEIENIAHLIGLKNEELCVDLYGKKQNNTKRYYLTTKSLNYKIIDSYSLSLRPHELNVVLSVPGHDIYLYDTTISNKNRCVNKKNKRLTLLKYDVRSLTFNDMKVLFFYQLIEELKRKTKKLTRILFKASKKNK